MQNFLIVRASPNLNRRQTEFHCVSRMPGVRMVSAKGMKKSSYVFSNCFKKTWAIQGLNLGPPDYESV